MMNFYICEHCGNIAYKLTDSRVPLTCCGSPMALLVPGLSDGATEKHLPAIYQVGDQVEIAVGIQAHPMTKEHFIDWVILETDTGFHVADLAAGQAPHASFRLAPMEQVAGAYAFCNLHGLWLTDASSGFGL